MDFNEFWKNGLPEKLKDKNEFKTLRQNKGFKVHFEQDRNGDPLVRVTLKSGESRANIPRYMFEGIWDNVKIHPHETRFVNKNGRLELYTLQNGGKGICFNLSYILALISSIVGDQNME